jgi:Cdc6-like AAA superfamily ATPase
VGVIILDDVTQVASWQELMNYLDGIYRAVQTPIFVTTNMFQFLDKLPEDVRHTLLFFRVDFGAYNAQELYSIIKDRVESSGAKFPVSQTDSCAIHRHWEREGCTYYDSNSDPTWKDNGRRGHGDETHA